MQSDIAIPSQDQEEHPGPTATLRARLETPASGEALYDQSIFISGWICVPLAVSGRLHLHAYLDQSRIAETSILSPRPDISRTFDRHPGRVLGFKMLGKTKSVATEAAIATLRVTATCGEQTPIEVARQPLRIVPASLNSRHYGQVLYPDNKSLLHRGDIYGSGPPLLEADSEALQLIISHLPEASSVIDIGCGAGVYAPALIAAGHNWLGLESSSECCAILQTRRLPFRRVDLASQILPCDDGEWDCGICIEVLEHTTAPGVFVKELSRIVRRRVLFSVPNMEVIPYLSDWATVPWHLLEADHKSFFTRASLRNLLEDSFQKIEIFFYREHPIKTRDGIPVYVHLFAVADK